MTKLKKVLFHPYFIGSFLILIFIACVIGGIIEATSEKSEQTTVAETLAETAPTPTPENSDSAHADENAEPPQEQLEEYIDLYSHLLEHDGEFPAFGSAKPSEPDTDSEPEAQVQEPPTKKVVASQPATSVTDRAAGQQVRRGLASVINNAPSNTYPSPTVHSGNACYYAPLDIRFPEGIPSELMVDCSTGEPRNLTGYRRVLARIEQLRVEQRASQQVAQQQKAKKPDLGTQLFRLGVGIALEQQRAEEERRQREMAARAEYQRRMAAQQAQARAYSSGNAPSSSGSSSSCGTIWLFCNKSCRINSDDPAEVRQACYEKCNRDRARCE